MEFEEKEIMEDDCLGITNKLCTELFKLRSVKILSFIIFIFISVMQIIETSVYLKKADVQYLIHYGPAYIIHYFSLLTSGLTFYTYKKVIQMRQDLCLWKINSAEKEIEAKITKESKYVNYCICGYLILGLFTGIQFGIPNHDDKDLFFFVAFFHEYFNKNLSHILTFWYRFMIYAPTLPIMIMPYCQFIYALTHVTLQLKMLVHYLEKMDGTSCQKEIKKRLVFCVKRHAQLYCVTNTTRRKVIVLILLVAISGAIIFPTLLIFCYLSTASIHKYFRFGSAFLLGGTAFIHIIHAGQLMEDNSNKIFETLLNVKWYNWNKENKQIYLIFLSNALKEIRINFSQGISLNYQLGASMMKAIYSFTSVLYQFRQNA